MAVKGPETAGTGCVGEDDSLTDTGGEHRVGDELLPLVDPGELLSSPVFALADGGADYGRLQPRERAAQELILAVACRAPDRRQELIGREAEEARSRQASIERLDDLRARPDQDVRVPDRRHAMFRHGVDLHFRISGFVADRGYALGLGQGEEGAFHEIALVAGGERAGERLEHIERRALAGGGEPAHRQRRA